MAAEFDDEINEAIYDAVCDGEGRATAYYLRHHLAKRGLIIAPAPPEPTPDKRDEALAASEALIHRNAHLEADLAVYRAERDAAVARAKSAEQDWANREADILRLTVQLEDATKHISDILTQSGREASLRIKTEAKLAEVRTERDALAIQIQTARVALEIIAGKRQCLDNLMGNRDVAEAALALLPSQPKEPT